jgi:protein-disulfide isomerase
VADLTKREIDAKIAAVTEDEVSAVYESAKDRFVGQAEENARRQIADSMRSQRIAKRRATYLKELRSRLGVTILLEPPRVDVDSDEGLTKGDGRAPITIVEYSDFQCPFCARLHGTLKKIQEKYANQVNIVFRDYPLPFHKDAPKAAEAARCAEDQGKFRDMQDVLFNNQKALSVTDLKRYATQLGLDMVVFGQCLDSGRHEVGWRASTREGEAYGVTSTPTAYVNGRFVAGAVPFEAFDEIINEELQRIEAKAGTHTTGITR